MDSSNTQTPTSQREQPTITAIRLRSTATQCIHCALRALLALPLFFCTTNPQAADAFEGRTASHCTPTCGRPMALNHQMLPPIAPHSVCGCAFRWYPVVLCLRPLSLCIGFASQPQNTQRSTLSPPETGVSLAGPPTPRPPPLQRNPLNLQLIFELDWPTWRRHSLTAAVACSPKAWVFPYSAPTMWCIPSGTGMLFEWRPEVRHDEGQELTACSRVHSVSHYQPLCPPPPPPLKGLLIYACAVASLRAPPSHCTSYCT